MYTQCPECGSAFRVTAEVLQQARGKVRCGNCRAAFNALDHLSESLAPRSEPSDAETGHDDSRNHLLDSMRELDGPDDVEIEDTGIEWRLIDEAKDRADSGEASAPNGAAADGGDDEIAVTATDDEPRYDDNTPLPDDFGADIASATPAFTPPTRRATDQLANEVVDDSQTELELGDPDDWASLLEEVADPPVVADSAVEIIEEASAATDAALAADTEKTDEDDAPSVLDTRIDAMVDADEEGSGFYTNSFRLIQDEDGDIALAEEMDDESPAVDDESLAEDLELALVDDADSGDATAQTSETPGADDDAGGGTMMFALADNEKPDPAVEPPEQAVDDAADSFAANPEATADWVVEADINDDLDSEAPDHDSAAAPKESEGGQPFDAPLDRTVGELPDTLPDSGPEMEAGDVSGDLAADQSDDESDRQSDHQSDYSSTSATATDSPGQDTDDTPDDEPDAHGGGVDERFETAIADAERDTEQADSEEVDPDSSAILAMTANMEIDPAVLRAMQENDASPMVETIVMEGDFVGAKPGLDDDPAEAEQDIDGSSADPESLLDTYISSRARESSPAPNRARLGAGIGVLLLLLAGQFVHSQREMLATYPLFQQTVAPIYRSGGMPVTPNWDIRGWQFEGVPEGSTDSEAALLTISSQLANRSGQALPYPLVHVSLTDRYEEVVGSRILEPNEYLGDSSDPARRVPAGETITATIAISTAASVDTATGFKLDVCYRDIPDRVRCAIQDFKRP